MSTLIKKNVSVKTEKIEKTYFTITKKKWRLEEQHLNSKFFFIENIGLVIKFLPELSGLLP